MQEFIFGLFVGFAAGAIAYWWCAEWLQMWTSPSEPGPLEH